MAHDVVRLMTSEMVGPKSKVDNISVDLEYNIRQACQVLFKPP